MNQEYLRSDSISMEQLPILPTHNTAVHEVMHGVLAEWYAQGNVVSIDVHRDGNILGKTVIRIPAPEIAATGLVHGEGYGGDYAHIVYDALSRGINPALAVYAAEMKARSVLSHEDEEVIDLVARKLSVEGSLTGDEFREALGTARDIQAASPAEEQQEDETQIFITSIQYDTHREIHVSIDGVTVGSLSILPDESMTQAEIEVYIRNQSIMTVTPDEKLVYKNFIFPSSGIIFGDTGPDSKTHA